MTQYQRNSNDRAPTNKKTKQQQAKQTQQEKESHIKQVNVCVQSKAVKEALNNLSSLEELPDRSEDLLKINPLNQQKKKLSPL